MRIFLLLPLIILMAGCATHLAPPSSHRGAPLASIQQTGVSKAESVTDVSYEQSSISRQFRCAELTEAQAYSMLSSGHTYLDADGDGHPCEWGRKSSSSSTWSSSGGNCHYVSGYRRKNGTYVRGHTRCR